MTRITKSQGVPYFKTTIWLLLAVVAIGSLQGCSDGRPKRVPVSGQVFLDSKPLKGDGKATIQIVPSSARPALGKIDDEGRFTLTTFEVNDGCIPGTHRVAVSYMIPLSGDRGFHWMLPKKYANAKTSGLQAVIEGPTDDLRIDLTWDGGKPFDEVNQ